MDNKTYIVVSANNLDYLTTLVNERLKEGYTLVGGVSVASTELLDPKVFIQAMIKSSEKATLNG